MSVEYLLRDFNLQSLHSLHHQVVLLVVVTSCQTAAHLQPRQRAVQAAIQLQLIPTPVQALVWKRVLS